jgi:hypothetical protein
MRKLIELPGVDDLELKALMKPRLADPDMSDEHPEVNDAVRAALGIDFDEAMAACPADWDGIDRLDPMDMVEAFEAEGWDVTDKRRKPLRMLPILALPLALAMRGIAGDLPFVPEVDHPVTDWGSNLKAEAKAFRKR